jgi:NAD(P)H dehydrogenase (quinone)
VGEVAADDLLSSDAVIVGSPVYFGNMSGEVKTFFDNWNLKFRLSRERRMGEAPDRKNNFGVKIFA